jgi:hypothetical protein
MIGWFGIRGIGSVFYLLFAMRHCLANSILRASDATERGLSAAGQAWRAAAWLPGPRRGVVGRQREPRLFDNLNMALRI